MSTLFKSAGLAAVLTLSAVGPAAVSYAGGVADKTIDGRWDASLTKSGTVIPFRLDISGSGPTLRGTFYDGFEPYEQTTSASFKDGKLTLNIEHYLTTISASVGEGKLVGTVATQNRGSSAQFGFIATRHIDGAAATANAPSIAGSWEIPLDTPSSKGEKAFRFVVKQNGAEVAASILRVDGDTGSFSGTYQDGKWTLSHFDGSRPGVIVVTPQADGTLSILQGRERPESSEAAAPGSNAYKDESAADSRYATKLTAYRSEVARAKGLPQPEDYEAHTTARDPREKFTFNFPDVNGKLVSNEDPRFKGKVVLAIVTGTWCPNCHDEAQYLVELDRKYRDKGLAIVALDFEEPEQQGSLTRAKAFVKQYGVKYTYLFPGAPAEMWEKVPQLVNLNTWPATVFIGRDGTVRGVHSGFASPASGEFHADLEKEFTAKIEGLLAEQADSAKALAAVAPNRSAGEHQL